MLDHIVLKHIVQDIDKISVNNQHELGKVLSSTTQFVTMVHNIMCHAESRYSVHAAVLDFVGALDKVSYPLLLQKNSRKPK